MAYQSEIELRVKVIDTELRALEQRYEKIQSRNPFSASGGRSGQTAQQNRAAQAALAVDKSRLNIAEQLNQAAVKELNKRTMMARLFKDAAAIRASYAKDAEKAAKSAEREAAAAQKTAAANRKQLIQGVQGAVAGGVISAAFPILTGGGTAESILGGAGSLLGSAFGPLGSFAGGIGGSALGRIIQDAEDLNKQLVSLNAQFSNTGAAALLTAGDVGELAKQLNITKEDVISLAGELAAFAQLDAIEDLAKAFGPVGGAGTFDALAQAAESEAAALKAIDGLRGQIGLKTAEELLKVLEIEGSEAAQAALLDALLGKTEDITTEVAKQVTFWDRVAAAIFTAASGQFIAPEDLAGKRAADIVGPNKSVIDKALTEYEKYLQNRRRLDEKYNPKAEKKGSAPAALPQSQELQLRQQILKTELSLADIETKRRALQASDLGVIKLQARALYDRLTTEIEILELARQQALVSSKVPEDAVFINNLYDQRLEKLKRENDLQREQNLLRGEQIKLQQTLTAIRNKQETEGVVKDLTRKIEDASSRDSVDSSASEMLALRIKQLRRREDLIGRITNKIEEQDAIIASGDVKKIPAAEKELEVLKNRKAAIEALLPVLDQVEQAELRQNQLMEKYGFIANEAATAMSSAVQSVITGTGSVQEAFSNMFANIGKAFIDMATQMIAKALVMKAIGILTSAFGSGGGGGIPFGSGPDLGIASGGGFGASFFGLAEGGYVTGPTNALIGEGGEPEYVIPESKMRESMGRYSRGSRGSSVIPAEGGGSTGAEGGVAVAAPIDVRYTVERINSVDYVTADQFQTGMKRAAAEGAQRGQQLTLSRLQQSPATRRRIGM